MCSRSLDLFVGMHFFLFAFSLAFIYCIITADYYDILPKQPSMFSGNRTAKYV